MSKNSFSERVPIFGEVNITFQRESRIIFEKFKNEIIRLEKINQLGILHDFLKIPRYTRYDYIIILSYLIEKAANSNSIFNSSISILNSEFTSLEELLKSWALLYSIGHFQMTFAAEHAFLKSISEDENKFQLLMEEIEDLFDNSDFFTKDEKDFLKGELVSIIEKQKIMSVYKLFSLLIISETIKNFHEKDKDKIKELTKLMIFKEDYLNYLSVNNEKFKLERKLKLEKVIKYFEIIRMLTFTILDGSISQRYLNLNPMVILENLNTFIENEDYKKLLLNINGFYTSDIYNAPESAYYHYRCVFQIQQSVFNRIDLKSLKNHNKWKNLDKKIDDAVNKVKTDIGKSNKLIEESGEDKNYIQEELKNHIRVKVNLEKPLAYECKTFGLNQPDKLFGGLIYNQADNSIEVDFYPNSIFSDQKRSIYNMLCSLKPIYDEVINKQSEEINFFKNLALIENFIPEDFDQNLSQLPHASESVVKDKLNNFLKIFDNVSRYLISLIFLPEVNFSSWNIDKINVQFPILFTNNELKTLIDLFENHANIKNQEEFEKNIFLLKEELLKHNSNSFYLFAPNSEFHLNGKIETEIDCLLIKFSLEDGVMLTKIGEVKRPPKNSFKEDQCLKQLQLMLNISESTGKSLVKSTLENDTSELELKFTGKTIDNLVLFERCEKI